MKINRSAPARDFGAVAKELTVSVHSDGAVSINTDLPGGKVEVTQAEDGAVTITEFDASGAAGESISISTVSPPADPSPVLPVPADKRG